MGNSWTWKFSGCTYMSFVQSACSYLVQRCVHWPSAKRQSMMIVTKWNGSVFFALILVNLDKHISDASSKSQRSDHYRALRKNTVKTWLMWTRSIKISYYPIAVTKNQFLFPESWFKILLRIFMTYSLCYCDRWSSKCSATVVLCSTPSHLYVWWMVIA